MKRELNSVAQGDVASTCEVFRHSSRDAGPRALRGRGDSVATVQVERLEPSDGRAIIRAGVLFESTVGGERQHASLSSRSNHTACGLHTSTTTPDVRPKLTRFMIFWQSGHFT